MTGTERHNSKTYTFALGEAPANNKAAKKTMNTQNSGSGVAFIWKIKKSGAVQRHL
jgi:hypothetical protein